LPQGALLHLPGWYSSVHGDTDLDIGIDTALYDVTVNLSPKTLLLIITPSLYPLLPTPRPRAPNNRRRHGADPAPPRCMGWHPRCPPAALCSRSHPWGI